MEGEPKADEPPKDEVEGSGSEDEEPEEEISEEEKGMNLLQACRDNKYEDVMFWLEKRAVATFEKDGWNPLLWASCNGNEKIVRELIKNHACQPYLQKSSDDNEDGKNEKNEDEGSFDPFQKPEDPRKTGKYTPLHWASYKGFHRIVWILLKKGMLPKKMDMYGNTAVHQAAAAGNVKVLECFLNWGIDVKEENARGHTPMDLATEPNTKQLLQKALKARKCEKCKTEFDIKNFPHYCSQSGKFYCINCSKIQWVYETWESEETERLVCRSLEVEDKIKAKEDDLSAAIDSYDYYNLDKSLAACAGFDIAVKLRKKAEVLHLKLQHELKISTFMKEKDHHDNYKDIRKDVQRITEMVEQAQNLEIDLEPTLIEGVNAFTFRLISERNLRKQRDLYLESIQSCDNDKVSKLQTLINTADENKVEVEYIATAKTLTSQMSGNIKARETLQMLLDYPEREYPEPEEIDPKKKDKKAPPKKKKKKADNFPTPEWAEELDAVIKKVNEMQTLVQDRENLKLDDEFIGKVTQELQRFKKEIKFRKDAEEEARLEAELKAAKKAKKKK